MNAKIFGITMLLVVLCGYLSITESRTFLSANNIENLLQRTALYGVLAIGVAFVIITSGIDLSIGSIVCLAGCLLAIFLRVDYAPPDQHEVLAVQATQQRIVLPGRVDAFQKGDRIRYIGRRAQNALVTVEAVSAIDFEHDRRTVKATALDVDKPFSRDDSLGQIAKVYSVESLTPGDAQSNVAATVTISGKHRLQARDRIDFVDPRTGLKTLTILSAAANDRSTTLAVSGSLGTLDQQWLAVPKQRNQRMPVVAAVGCVLLIALGLGLVHGLLVTKVRLQPFVVTLCGLLIYRGIARWIVDDQPQGFGTEYKNSLSAFAEGKLVLIRAENFEFGIPYPFFVLVGLAIVAMVFLNKTIWGRYMLALGRNEAAARYSGINTHAVTILAYVICVATAAIGGMLFALDSNSVSPSSFGNFFELYAIAAAVLGGCSLRGGEGGILGVIIGTAVMQTLKNLILIKKFPDSLELAIIGAVILIGVIADEALKAFAARRRGGSP